MSAAVKLGQKALALEIIHIISSLLIGCATNAISEGGQNRKAKQMGLTHYAKQYSADTNAQAQKQATFAHMILR